MFRKLLAVALATVSVSAQAAWHEAASKHFIVYAEGGEAVARDAAVRLEKFQTALRFLSGATAADSPVKVKVFLVSGMGAVQATMPFGGGGGVAGYYSATMRGPFTVMSRTTIRGSRGSRGEMLVADTSAESILFHELTHHYSHQYFPAAYPTWYSEGFAEFVGSMQIEPKDVISVGRPLNGRYAAFMGNDWLPVPRMLTAKGYRDVGTAVGLLYSEGWLLVHYLTITNNRPGQLKAYLSKVNQGMAFDKAANEAFGDLAKLDAELRAYASRGKLNALVLPFKKLETGDIAVRRLTAAEEDLLPFDIRLYAGVPAREAATFADKVAAAAARHADDPYALRILVEAQRLAGRTAAAGEAARRWLAVAPSDGLAIAADAEVQADALAAAKVRDAAQWTAVRRLYADAAKKAPDQPHILQGFYRTYVKQGVTPPESAQAALYQAFELLPQHDDLRREVAADFEMRGMIDDAIAVIRPAAFESTDPSELSEREKRKRDADKIKYKIAGEDDGETAREMLARLESKKAKAAR